ncbi:ATPase, AAA-type, core [uncultured Caudovirales phage]|uniref:ATPase, AAA-type, core n=1 Tax=uncultured Caudovirales phage TaxID=2100421 RepID=A0A6J5L8F6_9CAUD|nr:ATPase, AAA-type, core [uncultured Caudovirales phage]
MASLVRIINGTYRNSPIVDTVFPLVRPYQVGAKGGFVTVDASGMFGEARQIRVQLDNSNAYEFVNGDAMTEVSANTSDVVVHLVKNKQEETDEQIIERIRERFSILDDMTKAAIAGTVRAMIVSGAPGVGKSFNVEREIEKSTMFDRIAGRKIRSEVVKGSATALGVYATLYRYSDPECVLVFDDCDSLFADPVSLNLLKGALDTGKKRKISWLSDSGLLRREGIPDSFDFKGSVIFITNMNFSNVKSKTLQPHLEALESRCHYVDLTMNTNRDKLLRIKQVIADGMLDEYELGEGATEEIIGFIESNLSKLRELSLRTVVKVADLHKSFPDKWKNMAAVTVMK